MSLGRLDSSLEISNKRKQSIIWTILILNEHSIQSYLHSMSNFNSSVTESKNNNYLQRNSTEFLLLNIRLWHQLSIAIEDFVSNPQHARGKSFIDVCSFNLRPMVKLSSFFAVVYELHCFFRSEIKSTKACLYPLKNWFIL